VATLIDDHLGHAHVSMTQNVYMTGGRLHAQVAALLDRAVAVRDESAAISGE
jgi:integrase